MNIDHIEIAGFKSVSRLKLEQLKPYSVFAGPNGSGKSNLMDALAFVSTVIELGAVKAIRKFRGFPQIHCYKLRKNSARTFEFGIQATLNDQKLLYSLKIHEMDTNPLLEEKLTVGSRLEPHVRFPPAPHVVPAIEWEWAAEQVLADPVGRHGWLGPASLSRWLFAPGKYQ